MTAFISAVRREPARWAAAVLTVSIVVVNLVTGQAINVLVGEVVAVIALLERVRALVTPLIGRELPTDKAVM